MADDWKTDDWILNIFRGWFDPCPYKSTENGLINSWEYRNFINPPYSDPAPWVKRSIEEYKRGNICVLLLKVDTSTRWFKDLHEAGARFLWVHGRLKYSSGTAAPFPSMLAVLS